MDQNFDNDSQNLSEQPNGSITENAETTSDVSSEKTENRYVSDTVNENGIPYGGYTRPQQQPQTQYSTQSMNGMGADTSNYGSQYNQYRQQPIQQQFFDQVQNGENQKKSKKKGASKGFVISAIAVGILICVLVNIALVVFAGRWLYDNVGAGNRKVVVQYANDDENKAVTDKGTVAYVASVAADSVVEITTETVTTNSFFGQYVTQGAGSGVIISSDDGGSYIITCAHVISGSSKVTVTLRSGEKYDAEIIGSDSETDVGVIKANVKGLKCATVGDYSKVIVGEQVVAIGNPLGSLGGSVTSGYVSALDRDIMIDGTTYHLLQTDTAINPGNSGGGLFNTKGQLIGIVNAKSSGTYVEGLGFAIPIDEAMKIATQLIENGYVGGRAKLGFMLYDVDSSQAAYNFWAQYHINISEYGVYITSSESPDFKLGDRIIAIESTTVSSTSQIKSMLSDFKVGQKITITVSRENERGISQIKNIDLIVSEIKQ